MAILVSQDGWHLPRSELDKFDDVTMAYARRGAAFTFDGLGFSVFVKSLRTHGIAEVEAVDTLEGSTTTTAEKSALYNALHTIHAPGFSHTLKDPTPNLVAIYPHHRVVIIEGLYTFLGIEPWREASEILDERWFIDVDPKSARERLVKRHVATGVAKNVEEAEWRATNNDIPSPFPPIFVSSQYLNRQLIFG